MLLALQIILLTIITTITPFSFCSHEHFSHSHATHTSFHHTKLHTLHNTLSKTVYVGFYLENKQVPYINAQGLPSNNLIATIAAKGQLKLHIPYVPGYLVHTYPDIYYTDDKDQLTSCAQLTAQLVGNQKWHYGNKKTAWQEHISFISHDNAITIREGKPQRIAHKNALQSPSLHVKPYRLYTFENTLPIPVYVACYINNQKVPYYDYHTRKSTNKHIVTISEKSKETITIPYIKGWPRNNYPVLYFSTSETTIPTTLTSLHAQSTYNLNHEPWGYFTFSDNNPTQKLTLTATHIKGAKAALAHPLHYTISNNTNSIIHFNAYYQSHDGTFKSAATLGDKQYALNAVRGKQSRSCVVPKLPVVRIYATPYQHLLSEQAPLVTSRTPYIHYFELPIALHNLYNNIVISYDKQHKLTLTMGPNAFEHATTTLLDSLFITPFQLFFFTKNIISAFFHEIDYSNILNLPLNVSAAYQEQHYEKICQHPACYQEATITTSKGLSPEEKCYLSDHAPHEIIDGTPIRIALCSSGGGYRALIGTLGFLDGLQKINLLNHTTYHAGLSGSCWALAGWYTAETTSVKVYKDALFSRASRFLYHELYDQNNKEIKHTFNQIIRDKVLYPATPFSIISPFGAIIAQRVLTTPHPETLFVTTHKKQQAHMPLCLHTAIIPQEDIEDDKKGFHWVEFSPYHVNLINYDGEGRIPLWAFGRQFDHAQKQSINYAPPYSLPFCLGMWGSALSASIQELTVPDKLQSHILPLFKKLQKKLTSTSTNCIQNNELFSINSEKIQQLLSLALNTKQYQQLEKYEIFTNGRFLPARIASWLPSTNPLLTVVDAGIDFNIPLPPLLLPERGVDVIIINDLSANLHTLGGYELQKALHYAKNTYGFEYTIPGETYLNVLTDKALSTDYLLSLLKKHNRSYIIFEPKHTHTCQNVQPPLIIYIPLLDPHHATQLTETFATQKFSYTKEEADMLYNAVRYKIDTRIIEEIKRFKTRK